MKNEKHKKIKNYTEWESAEAMNGWIALSIITILTLVTLVLFISKVFLVGMFALPFVVAVFMLFGLFSLNPNHTAVATFFGKSMGNITGTGLLWTNPFYTINRISTRSNITQTTPRKVNDLSGNPLNVTIQGTWHIKNPANSEFNIDMQCSDYVSNVFTNTLREVISQYDYDGEYLDNGEVKVDKETTYLKVAGFEIAEKLKERSQSLLSIAGVQVTSVELVDISYAPEIAASMLQTQQAKAFLNARRQIVKGATSVALTALKDLQEKNEDGVHVAFTEQQKADLVSNLLIVLCGDTSAQPVINISRQ